MSSAEAAKIWHKNSDYVRTSLHKNPKRWPKGSWRKFGRQIVVTTYGMEQVTGIPDPRKNESKKSN
ncbi:MULTISPECIES: helix-turn-helix domain-containing protein [Lactobacillus]|nr:MULTISPECIES: helix-turn-helix domain-containing protein [Lactobacillus]